MRVQRKSEKEGGLAQEVNKSTENEEYMARADYFYGSDHCELMNKHNIKFSFTKPEENPLTADFHERYKFVHHLHFNSTYYYLNEDR